MSKELRSLLTPGGSGGKVTPSLLKKRPALAQWTYEAKGDGEPPAVPDELLKDRADHPELSVPDDHPRFSGYRLVDIARLDQFVSDHFCWADNAPTRQQDPLAKFVAWAVKKEYSADSRFARKLQTLMGAYRRTGPGRRLRHEKVQITKETHSAFCSYITFSSGGTAAMLQTSDDIPFRKSGKGKSGRVCKINLRLNQAFMNIGRGNRDLHKVAAICDIPLGNSFLSGKCWKRWSKHVGPNIETVAKESCTKAMEAEKIASKAMFDAGDTRFAEIVRPSDSKSFQGIYCGVDGGWHKRGKHANSMGGVVAAVGVLTKSVVNYVIKQQSGSCRTCKYGEKAGKTIDRNFKAEHDCRARHDGTAKSMEAAGLVDLCYHAVTQGALITGVVADLDSTMEASVQAIDLTQGDETKGMLPQWMVVRHFLRDPTHMGRAYAKYFFDVTTIKAPGIGAKNASEGRLYETRGITPDKLVAKALKKYFMEQAPLDPRTDSS